MKYRVIQWATGGVGRAAIEGIVTHPELELVGCWVHDRAKKGRDAGDLAGIGPVGVPALHDEDAVLALPADCVVYCPLLAKTAQVERILRSGKNVVTPLGWFFPSPGPDIARIEAACRAANVTLHGTGIHPGGMSDRFPLMLSALSRAVTHIRAEEFSDIRGYGAAHVVGEIMLFGKTPDEASKSPMLRVLGAGFRQSMEMVGTALGVQLDDDTTARHEIAVATAPIASPIGTITPGRVAAQRFTWQGTVGGVSFVTLGATWLMGDEHLDPPWRFGPDGQRFEVAVGGDPPVRAIFRDLHPSSVAEGLTRNRAVVATAMHCVNAIPYVCRAEPGIKTYLDLPLVAGRAAPELIRRSL
jgi:hypothetical protein